MTIGTHLCSCPGNRCRRTVVLILAVWFLLVNPSKIDVFPSLPVAARFESSMDFSQSYLKSGLSVAVPAEARDSRWINLFASSFSAHVLKAIGLLVVLSMMAGAMVWSFEKRRNNEMFGDGTACGVGHGIWWAIVTKTTVGYGDKATARKMSTDE